MYHLHQHKIIFEGIMTKRKCVTEITMKTILVHEQGQPDPEKKTQKMILPLIVLYRSLNNAQLNEINDCCPNDDDDGILLLVNHTLEERRCRTAVRSTEVSNRPS